MCTYITYVASPDTDLRSLSAAFGHALERVGNSHAEAQLDAGELWLAKQGPSCDCDTALGSSNRRGRDSDPDHARGLAKLRKQGWGEAKLEKWLENKRRSADKAERNQEAARAEGRRELQRPVESMRRALDSGVSTEVWVVLHDYSGELESEQLELRRRERRSLHSLETDELFDLEEDVLYSFRP